jgi:nucleotide-binding universal stress UspA family protein
VPKATGETILKTATELKAGVIIAGAYSHSRVREGLLGGVTVTLMKKAHIPVFFAN